MAQSNVPLPETRDYTAQSPGFYFSLIAWSLLPLLGAALFLVYFALKQEHLSLTGYLFFFSLSAGLLLIGAYIMLLYKHWSFRIGEQRITETGVFSSTDLEFRSIKGVRFTGGPLGILTFYPKDENNRVISLQLFPPKNRDLIEWAQKNFRKLYIVDDDADEDEDDELPYGRPLELHEQIDKPERIISLQVMPLLFGLPVFIYGLVYPHPYQLLFLFFMLLPLVCAWQRRETALHEELNLFLFSPFFMSSMLMYIITYRKWESLSDPEMDLPGMGMVLLLFIIYSILLLPVKMGIPGIASLLFCSIMNGYSLATFVNCAFDESPSRVREMKVIKKLTDQTRLHKVWYLDLDGGPEYPGNISVMVSPKKYQSTKRNDTIKVTIRKGLLGVTWIPK